MAERTLEELADDRSGVGVNPGGIDNSILAAAGGSGASGGGSVLAFDPYTSPYITPRRVFFTINTYTNLSRTDIIAKAYLDGIEIEEQSNSKGRIVFSLNEQRLLNPSVLTLVSGDLKPQKYFIIQARKDVENQVSVIEIDSTPDPTPVQIGVPTGEGFGGGTVDTTGGQYDGSGGAVTRGGGGGFTGGGYEDGRGGLGRDLYVSEATNRENIQ